jgi:hypothetical protein
MDEVCVYKMHFASLIMVPYFVKNALQKLYCHHSPWKKSKIHARNNFFIFLLNFNRLKKWGNQPVVFWGAIIGMVTKIAHSLSNILKRGRWSRELNMEGETRYLISRIPLNMA